MVSPAEFIPLAEETGLIIPIGEWVLRTACAEAATWPDHIRVGVNLSAVQFKNRKLVEVIMNALAAARLSPHRLELEITESVLLQDDEATLAMLHQMRGLGVRISMDDFGTGYSSLSYLRKFPFDKIKIDQSFIRDLSKGDDSIAIVRAVASLAASLNIATVAEGVETADQLDIARTEGCTEVQGYFFSRPVPAAKARELLTVAVGRLSHAA
jgi:EAL domain-containing protein (putative c-di-GMP-specific phosphodiesterase class I)